MIEYQFSNARLEETKPPITTIFYRVDVSSFLRSFARRFSRFYSSSATFTVLCRIGATRFRIVTKFWKVRLGRLCVFTDAKSGLRARESR